MSHIVSICGNILLLKEVLCTEIDRISSNYIQKICKENILLEGVAFFCDSRDITIYRFFNPDGTEEIMCGNSLFAISWLKGKTNILLKNKKYIHLFEDKKYIILDLRLNNEEIFKNSNIIDVGTLHYIQMVENISKINWQEIVFSEKLNYTVYYIEDNYAIARTFERGVNSETSSCGTGAISTFIHTFIQNKKIEIVKYNNYSYQFHMYFFSEKKMCFKVKLLKESIKIL